MKIIFSLLAIFILNQDCNQEKSTDQSTSPVNSEKSNAMQEDTTIIYEALTRGFYEKIWISKDSITVTNDRNQMEKMSLPTPKNDWNELMDLLKKVNVKSLPNLEAPTSMRHHDGAAFATLKVVQNKSETSTESFDHGHPPKEIEPLVNKVLSMRELLSKK